MLLRKYVRPQPFAAGLAVTIAATFIFAASALLAQDADRERLNKSPRHHEWVKVASGGRTVHAFLVFPEIAEKATAVVVIHENRGLTDWVRSVADQLAEQGYLAIAPDLLSGMAPGAGRTTDFADSDAARTALYELKQPQIMADLQAVADYVAGLEASNGTVAVAGFCWGGRQAWEFASHRENLAAAFVFYGTAPPKSNDLARIQCPVYGFYGGNDARINQMVPGTTEQMRRLEKKFDPVTYDGAGHGFMRAGEAPDASEANKKARAAAWQRWLELLKAL